MITFFHSWFNESISSSRPIAGQKFPAKMISKTSLRLTNFQECFLFRVQTSYANENVSEQIRFHSCAGSTSPRSSGVCAPSKMTSAFFSVQKTRTKLKMKMMTPRLKKPRSKVGEAFKNIRPAKVNKQHLVLNVGSLLTGVLQITR